MRWDFNIPANTSFSVSTHCSCFLCGERSHTFLFCVYCAYSHILIHLVSYWLVPTVKHTQGPQTGESAQFMQSSGEINLPNIPPLKKPCFPLKKAVEKEEIRPEYKVWSYILISVLKHPWSFKTFYRLRWSIFYCGCPQQGSPWLNVCLSPTVEPRWKSELLMHSSFSPLSSLCNTMTRAMITWADLLPLVS